MPLFPAIANSPPPARIDPVPPPTVPLGEGKITTLDHTSPSFRAVPIPHVRGPTHLHSHARFPSQSCTMAPDRARGDKTHARTNSEPKPAASTPPGLATTHARPQLRIITSLRPRSVHRPIPLRPTGSLTLAQPVHAAGQIAREAGGKRVAATSSPAVAAATAEITPIRRPRKPVPPALLVSLPSPDHLARLRHIDCGDNAGEVYTAGRTPRTSREEKRANREAVVIADPITLTSVGVGGCPGVVPERMDGGAFKLGGRLGDEIERGLVWGLESGGNSLQNDNQVMDAEDKDDEEMGVMTGDAQEGPGDAGTTSKTRSRSKSFQRREAEHRVKQGDISAAASRSNVRPETAGRGHKRTLSDRFKALFTSAPTSPKLSTADVSAAAPGVYGSLHASTASNPGSAAKKHRAGPAPPSRRHCIPPPIHIHMQHTSPIHEEVTLSDTHTSSLPRGLTSRLPTPARLTASLSSARVGASLDRPTTGSAGLAAHLRTPLPDEAFSLPTPLPAMDESDLPTFSATYPQPGTADLYTAIASSAGSAGRGSASTSRLITGGVFGVNSPAPRVCDRDITGRDDGRGDRSVEALSAHIDGLLSVYRHDNLENEGGKEGRPGRPYRSPGTAPFLVRREIMPMSRPPSYRAYDQAGDDEQDHGSVRQEALPAAGRSDRCPLIGGREIRTAGILGSSHRHSRMASVMEGGGMRGPLDSPAKVTGLYSHFSSSSEEEEGAGRFRGGQSGCESILDMCARTGAEDGRRLAWGMMGETRLGARRLGARGEEMFMSTRRGLRRSASVPAF